MIAIISHPQDPHAQRVIQHLEKAEHPVFLLSLADLPHEATLTIEYLSNGQPQVEYRRTGQPPIDMNQIHTVWWRRPQSADVSAVTDPDVRLFTANEWNEAINGLWQLLGARWMNDPIRDEVAGRKALQLRLAAEAGLRVPRTVVTSDPDKAGAFIKSQGLGRTIYKTFSCTHAIWRETRLVREEDLSVLDTVRLAPVIFQEYIPQDADLRITIIGDELFPAAIFSKDTDYPVDFRMSLGQAKTEVVELLRRSQRACAGS